MVPPGPKHSVGNSGHSQWGSAGGSWRDAQAPRPIRYMLSSSVLCGLV